MNGRNGKEGGVFKSLTYGLGLPGDTHSDDRKVLAEAGRAMDEADHAIAASRLAREASHRMREGDAKATPAATEACHDAKTLAATHQYKQCLESAPSVSSRAECTQTFNDVIMSLIGGSAASSISNPGPK